MKGRSYRSSQFEKRFVQYRHNFRIKIIKKKSSYAIFIMKLLTIAMYLTNPELNYANCINILSKIYLKSLCNVVSIDSLIIEKSDDHSSIIFHPEYLVNIFEHTGWENNYGIDCTIEIDSINLTFQEIRSLKIISSETRSPKLCI
jgi:hypothetical protein